MKEIKGADKVGTLSCFQKLDEKKDERVTASEEDIYTVGYGRMRRDFMNRLDLY